MTRMILFGFAVGFLLMSWAIYHQNTNAQNQRERRQQSEDAYWRRVRRFAQKQGISEQAAHETIQHILKTNEKMRRDGPPDDDVPTKRL